MIKNRLLQSLESALKQAGPELNGLVPDDSILAGLRLERPRNPEHGDYAVNVSFLSRHTRMAPPSIAEILAAHLADPSLAVTVIGGYLNFKLTDTLLKQALADLVHSPAPGRNDSLTAERILLEYVSANPTGPLHVGHGRWAALGDSLVRILRHSGAFVTPEFYINDFGFQMEKLALSLWWRGVELLKNEGALAGASPDEDILQGRELPYPGEFVIGFARLYLEDDENRTTLASQWQRFQEKRVESGCVVSDITELAEWGERIKQGIIDQVAPKILAGQKLLLEAMRVHFEVWTSEKQAIHQAGLVEATMATLREKGFVYEAEDAVWFKSSEFGDEKDRVLRKSDGSYTYLAPDIAYHHGKFNRTERYNRIMNIWGADHHGYIPRMRGAITALGHDPEQFEVLLGQLVNLIVAGERTRMGKRRKMLTLEDVIRDIGGMDDEEVLSDPKPDIQAKVCKGVDATRFWMVSKSADSALDFDVDLAASASSENPVFYVQYAHARCCSILRNATESAPNVDTGEIQAPYVEADALLSFQSSLGPEELTPLFESLPGEKEQAALKTLLLHLDGFEDIVKDAARLRAPHFICQYLLDLAANFHAFYNVCRILTPDPQLTRVRLMLIVAIRKVLAQGLDLLGVSAPERM